MRILFVRGALITCFTIIGLFGSAASVQFDGMSASVETYSAEARMKADPSCRLDVGYPPYGGGPPFWKCVYE